MQCVCPNNLHLSTFHHRDCIGTFVSDVSFQITCCVEDSRARFTFEFLFITNTLRHVTAPTIFSQLLQVISLWDSMCVFSFVPPLHVFSHFSQVSTRSSCFVAMCILRCLSDGASNLHIAQEGMVTANLFYWQYFWMSDTMIFPYKKQTCRFWILIPKYSLTMGH